MRSIKSGRVASECPVWQPPAAGHSLWGQCPCRRPDDRPSSPCSACPLQGRHLQKPGGRLHLTRWAAGADGGADQPATWARARGRVWILTPELQGQKLAALGSYKNGKSRFFTM